jgi:hypothetical protein
MDCPIPTFASSDLGTARQHPLEGIPPRGTSFRPVGQINVVFIAEIYVRFSWFD